MKPISKLFGNGYKTVTQWQMINIYYRIAGRTNPLRLIVPEGKEKAVVISYDVETFAIDEDKPKNVPSEYSDYLPALLDLFKSHAVKAHFFVCGRAVEQFSDTMKELLNCGHGFGGHGYRHERMTELNYMQQNHVIRTFKDLCVKYLNIQPITWRSPYAASNFDTYRALNENGFSVSSSTRLTALPLRIGNLLELPYAVMDVDILGYNSPVHWRKWVETMKTVIRSTRHLTIFGLHPWLSMRCDPNLEGMKSFLDWFDTQNANTWIGSLDGLVANTNKIHNEFL